jgi:hypothetical protein
MAFQALNHTNVPIPKEVLEAFADQPKLGEQITAFICTESNIPILRNADILTTSVINSSESLQHPGVSEY